MEQILNSPGKYQMTNPMDHVMEPKRRIDSANHEDVSFEMEGGEESISKAKKAEMSMDDQDTERKLAGAEDNIYDTKDTKLMMPYRDLKPHRELNLFWQLVRIFTPHWIMMKFRKVPDAFFYP